jgi:hypothetical protein
MEIGGTAVFQLQPNGAITAGSVAWTADDTNITLTPSSDGLTVQAADAAGDTASSFDLTASFEDSNGNPLTSTITVMLQGATVQPPAPATSATIEQIA